MSGLAVRSRLFEFADVVAEADLDITRLVKALVEKLLQPFLGGGSSNGCSKRFPFWNHLSIRGQARHIDELLDFAERLLVERRNARSPPIRSESRVDIMAVVKCTRPA